MPKVRTLRWHQNVHGVHEVDDEYQHARPETDVGFGYVELVEPTVAELKDEAGERNIELPEKGSGKGGAVVKADIATAVDEA